jgi:hypothetical protein
MQKIIFMLVLSLFLALSHASKLSKFLNEMDKKDQERHVRELQQDMDFKDFVFRLEKRYVDEHGAQCRDYEFRARSNPFRHGYYTVCDER